MSEAGKSSEIVITPQQQVGVLSFSMCETDVDNLLGPPVRSLPMSNNRQLLVYSGDIDTVTCHPEYGVTGVSVSTAPVTMQGKDIFTMSLQDIKSWLQAEEIDFESSESEDASEYVNMTIPDWSVIISFLNNRVDSIEAGSGRS